MNRRIAVLPGDGIGPEVTAAAVAVLETIGERFGHDFAFEEHPIGGAAVDQFGDPLPASTLAAAKNADAVLLGAVGGPRWDSAPAAQRPEKALLALRRELGVFANLRPVRPHPALVDLSPLRAERLADVDVLFVRELTGGAYFGEPKRRWIDSGIDSATDSGTESGTDRGVERAVDTVAYDEREISRVVELAFRLAGDRRQRVTSIDKANVLETSRLWRDIANRVGRANPDIALEHQLVDSAAMRLITHAASFDVVVTENMFGDILTDEAAVLVGSLGLLPSASLGAGNPGLYEPIHGSAPDIAGRGIANPIGAILSAALLLRWSFDLEGEAQEIEGAVDRALTAGLRTADLGGAVTTEEATAAILREM